MYASASLSLRTSNETEPLTPRRCRVHASLLLKALASPEPGRARRAAERFRALPDFAGLEVERILAWRGDIRRKHALAVVAAELGYASWSALKARLDTTIPVILPRRLFGRLTGGFLNRWYRRYEEAREGQRARHGMIFPYLEHFAVCDPEFLAALGLQPSDPDWSRIGWDWVQPRDAAAYRRLAWKLQGLGLAAVHGMASGPAALPPAPRAPERRDEAEPYARDGEALEDAPPSLVVGRTIVLVRDYEEALIFYRDLVGFDVLHDDTTPDGQRLLHVGTPGRGGSPAVGLWLLRASGESEALVGRQAGEHPLLVLYTNDCAAAYARLSARGVRFAKPPAVLGRAVFAPFLDVYGNKIILAELQAGG